MTDRTGSVYNKNCGSVLGTTTQNNNNCCNDKSTCIDVDKIYDSAKDKECIEDLRVFVGCDGQEIIDNATNIRCQSSEVIWANISVHDVAFNKGYYAVDIRFYFKICFEACVNGNAREFCGIAVYDKQTIMFGSEGNVKMFCSTCASNDICAGLPHLSTTNSVTNNPKVVLEVAAPICLNVKIADRQYNYGCCCCAADQIPDSIWNSCCAPISPDDYGIKNLYVTLGLFTLTRMERPVSLLIDNAQYCVPERESNVLSDSTTDPCAIFNNMSFPTCDFFPPSFGAVSSGIAGGEQCTECPSGSVLGTTTTNDNCSNRCSCRRN